MMTGQMRKTVGLALGGGVVRGMAHIGVLRALDEAGVPIDLVAGTSAGAIMAVGICFGRTPAQIEAFARRMSWLRLLRPAWPVRGLASFAGLRAMLLAEYGEIDLADLPRPIVIATTDMVGGQPVYLRRGPLATLVTASCSVPGFIEPTLWENMQLVEGGMTDMLPVTPLRSMGADYVIAVDIFSFKLRKLLGPLGYLLGGLEVALERTGGGMDEADCLIRPELAGGTYMRFSQRDRLIALGYQATQAQLPAIRRDLGLDAGDSAAPPFAAGDLPLAQALV